MKIKKTIRRLGNKYALRNAVKEGLDMLPTAVCFFYPSGTIRLCNAAMQKLFREIAGSDLQSYGELKEALDNCNPTTGIIRGGSMFVFPDGKTWQYHEQIVKTADGTVYTESVFSDVTGMYEKKQELKQQSGELKKNVPGAKDPVGERTGSHQGRGNPPAEITSARSDEYGYRCHTAGPPAEYRDEGG